MIKEKNIENGVRIFCIFLKYDFGNIEGKGEKMLQENTELGETHQYYNSDSLLELSKIFNTINEAIQTNYKLKLNK